MPTSARLCAGEIVHHDDVARFERRHENLRHVSLKRQAVRGPVQGPSAQSLPLALSAPTKVVVFQWPCGSAATQRWP